MLNLLYAALIPIGQLTILVVIGYLLRTDKRRGGGA